MISSNMAGVLGVKLEGTEKINKALAIIGGNDLGMVEYAGIATGVKMLRGAMVRAAKGRIKLEVSQKFSKKTQNMSTNVGLGARGYSAKVARPHGKYLEFGTPYIEANHKIENAYKRVQPRLLTSMARAARRRLYTLAEKARKG